MMKWLECNIYLKDYTRTNEALKKVIKPFADTIYANEHITKSSWHFFREPQICLRAYSKNWFIDALTKMLDEQLNTLEKRNSQLYEKHIFGAFAKEGEEYKGESDFYGKEAWKYHYKRWESGSNLALALCTQKNGKTIPFHYTRDIHLFENQLGFEFGDAISILLKWTDILMGCDTEYDYSKYMPILEDMYLKTKRESQIEGI